MKAYKWCAIDSEGDVGKRGIIGASFWSDYTQVYITDPRTIKDIIIDHAENKYTFLAHNAEYDMSVLFWQLDIPMKAVYFNGRFNRGEWRYHPKRPLCQLWDTLALSGGLSLKALGVAIGLPKYDTPQRLLGIDPNQYNWKCDTHNNWECEACYALRDVEIVYTFMTGLDSTLDAWGIEPKRRLSSLAASVWKAFDKPEPVQLENKRIRKLARQSYHGGRTETFKLGTVSPVYTADVTSMYPSVMLTTSFPDPSLMARVENPDDSKFVLNCEGVADVTVTVPNMYIPPLPYTDHGNNRNLGGFAPNPRTSESPVSDGRLYYPVGRFRGVYTTMELRYALSLGCTVNRIHQIAYSPRSLSPFTNFINTLWAMREAYKRDNNPLALFAKLLMNNLYGYLGMRDELERRDIYMAEPGKPLDRQPMTEWYTENGKLFLYYSRNQRGNNQWANVMWASYITAAARIALHRHMIAQGDALVYCDTDSVFSMRPIQGLGEGLGALRPDGDYQSAVISAPKLYALESLSGEWKAKAKGVSRAVALDFLRTGSATFQAPIRPLSQGVRGIAAGTWVDVTREQRYSIARRMPRDPDVLLTGKGWTDTAPVYVGSGRG